MIKKIISGGQTGADRGALDAAVKLGIPHGGWIPKGRLTEDGPLPDKYRLQETATTNYAERTEKNVLEADGTLILSHGPLTGGSEYTREMAIKHRKPWLHLDLERNPAFQAASMIVDWIVAKNIETLNVAGPRASKDPRIYQDTKKILETVYYLGMIKDTGMNTGRGASSRIEEVFDAPPTTVEEAVEHLLSKMQLKDRATVANMSIGELPDLYMTLGRYIMNKFGLLSGNTKLLDSCRRKARHKLSREEDAVPVIIEALWRKLQRTHKLRLVK